MDGLERCGVDGLVSLPRLFCAPLLRCVTVSNHLVLLDVSAGSYDVVDQVGAAMWEQLLREPDDRDLAGVAGEFGVSLAVVESDFSTFAAEQRAVGRLVSECPRPGASRKLMPRERPTIWRAFRERASAQRELQRGFGAAYARRTAWVADSAAPRIAVDQLVQRFRTADGLFPAREAPLDCLPRSLALTRFLRLAGWPAEHVIGVALHPFEAHAWVEVDGAAIDENPASLHRYTPIARA